MSFAVHLTAYDPELQYITDGPNFAFDGDPWEMGRSLGDFIAFVLATHKYPEDNTKQKHLSRMEQSDWESTETVQVSVLLQALHGATATYDGVRVNVATTSEQTTAGNNLQYYQKADLRHMLRVYVVGDLHGSLHSFCEIVQSMLDANHMLPSGVLAPGIAFVCTGDFLDRSPYTLECFYIICMLRALNPTNVFLTLGNHEHDKNQWNERSGTMHELRALSRPGRPLGNFPEVHKAMLEFLQYVPVSVIAATAVGTVQFNHGTHEQPVEGSPYDVAFQQFVKSDANRCMTTLSESNKEIPNLIKYHMPVLLWGDLASKALPPPPPAMFADPLPITASARVVSTWHTLQAYLRKYNIQLLVRGHQDLCNLTLMYGHSHQPEEALQAEGGHSEPFNGIVGGTFLNNPTKYDLWTLALADGQSTVKTVRSDSVGSHLLAVTLSSCPYSKASKTWMSSTVYGVLSSPAYTDRALSVD